MSTLLIGDIHGCLDELHDLLDLVGPGEADRIIALGDIVDRGPRTPEVLRFFRETPNARTLMGNHERKHFRSACGLCRPALSQGITRQQLGEEAYADAWRYMEALPTYVELPEALLVHGFYEPGVPVAAQREQVIVGVMSGERYLQQRHDRAWYELYDGELPIVVGHRNYLRTGEPLIYRERVYGIDTGCVKGGRLTGLLLPGFRLYSVPARADHWAEIRQAYTGKRHRQRSLGWDSRAERALELLHALVEQLTSRLLEELRCECRFDDLPANEQGKQFARKIQESGNQQLSRLLHRMRKNNPLDVGDLRDAFTGPRALLEFARQVGIDPEQ